MGDWTSCSCAKHLIQEPFAVINADDYYGKESFVKIHDYLCQDEQNEFCMAGFILKNTLSDNGGVTRGICKVDENGYLSDVVETSDIVKTNQNGIIGAAVDGITIDSDSYVSMNMWGLRPEFMTILDDGFTTFFNESVSVNPLKTEYLLPILIGQLLQDGKVSVKVLETDDKWFGVTYKEDKPVVVESFKALIEDGVYQKELFSDLALLRV